MATLSVSPISENLMLRKHLTSGLLAALILGFGVVYCMAYGYHGLHSIDSGIVFEGAWRIMSGQHFITDFDTPNGFVPIQIQVLFFKVFGVNWWAYRLHAGIFNGLFGLLVFWILRMVGQERGLALLFGLLSCVIFYPPMGVPYMEQHSFFFLLLGVALTLRATLPGARAHLWLAMVPATWVLSILSKQNPGLLAPLLSLIAWACHSRKNRVLAAVKGLSIGILPAFLALIWIFGSPMQLFGENWADFWQHFWVLPREIGNERFAEWNYGPMKTVRNMLWLPFQVILPELNFQFRQLLIVPFYLFLAEWAWRTAKGRLPMPKYPVKHLILGLGLVVCCSFFMRTSQNQLENGLCLAFLGIGLGIEYWKAWLLDGPIRENWQQASGWIWRAVAVFVAGTAVWAGIRFDREVNATRLVLDFPAARSANSLDAPKLGIDGLEFQAPYDAGFNDSAALVRWLQSHPGEVGYFGDMRFVLALGGKTDNFPSLWLHPGLTMPRVDSPEMEAFDMEFLSRLRAKPLKYMIFELENRRNYLGFQWECMPKTAAFVEGKKLSSETLGGFTIWTLQD
ncbi:MAG: hypothetical protein U0176_06560 [Bacteroidia bacterium]